MGREIEEGNEERGGMTSRGGPAPVALEVPRGSLSIDLGGVVRLQRFGSPNSIG